jgi:hypothetical protein
MICPYAVPSGDYTLCLYIKGELSLAGQQVYAETHDEPFCEYDIDYELCPYYRTAFLPFIVDPTTEREVVLDEFGRFDYDATFKPGVWML